MSLVASKKLVPQEWVEALVGMEPKDLEDEPFGPLVLLIRSPEDDDSRQFEKHLVACVMKEASVTGEHPKWPATAQFPTMNMSSGDVTEADQIELLAELASATHCLVPLRSRSRAGCLLGRAPSSTIRLSDPSVSSEHARVYVENGSVQLEDLSSKNGTTLNGRRLEPEETPWLQPMDRLTFGRVQAFVCDPRVLRAVIRQDLRTLM